MKWRQEFLFFQPHKTCLWVKLGVFWRSLLERLKAALSTRWVSLAYFFSNLSLSWCGVNVRMRARSRALPLQSVLREVGVAWERKLSSSSFIVTVPKMLMMVGRKDWLIWKVLRVSLPHSLVDEYLRRVWKVTMYF